MTWYWDPYRFDTGYLVRNHANKGFINGMRTNFCFSGGAMCFTFLGK